MSRRDIRLPFATSSFADSVGARRLTPARAVLQEQEKEVSFTVAAMIDVQ